MRARSFSIGPSSIPAAEASATSGFTIYDEHPSPLPPFAGFTFAPDFVPVAEKLDTITKATLIVSLF